MIDVGEDDELIECRRCLYEARSAVGEEYQHRKDIPWTNNKPTMSRGVTDE